MDLMNPNVNMMRGKYNFGPKSTKLAGDPNDLKSKQNSPPPPHPHNLPVINLVTDWRILPNIAEY